jgi:hypothetical protein
MANLLGQIGPWMDMSWEIPTCTLHSASGVAAKKGLTWKQYIMASIMIREARERKGSMNVGQAANQFLFTNRFICNWAIHSTPFYGNAVIVQRTINIVNRPASYGIQRGQIQLHNAYADEESYMIAVNPTFRPDPNVAFETFGAGNSSKQWITWDDVWVAAQAVKNCSSWNQCVPMYMDGSYLAIDSFSASNLLLLRWAYRYARQYGLTICAALDAMKKAKALNVSLSTTGVDEFSGVTLQKTYRVYISHNGWALSSKAFGPTLVIPPADVRDSNRRNQNEDTRKRVKRVPPSYEFYLMESMSLPHPALFDNDPYYSSSLGYSSARRTALWTRIYNAAIYNQRSNPNRSSYTTAYRFLSNDLAHYNGGQVVLYDTQIMRNAEDPNMVQDEQGRTAYDIWAEDGNYGVQHVDTWGETFDDIGDAVVQTGNRIGTVDDGPGPAGTFPSTVRG